MEQTIEEKYSEIYESQLWMPQCPTNYIRNPLDLECYHNDSEMGKFIRIMLHNLDKKKIQLNNNKLKLEKAGITELIKTTDIGIKDFLNNYILKFDDIDVFLDSATCESPGIAYEFLWTICIYFKLCDDIFPNAEYGPMEGKSNLPETLKPLNISIWLKDRKINTGSGSGAADIIFKKKIMEPTEYDVCDSRYDNYEPAEYILIQSKLIRDEIKSVASDYDMTKIKTLFSSDNEHLMRYYGHNNKPRIVLFVRDKTIVINKISNLPRANKHIFANFNIETDIYDKSDLEKYYRRLKSFLSPFIAGERYNFDKIIDFYKKETTVLIPRLHQLMTLFKTIDRLEKSTHISSNTFLYGAVARSGKTYMMGELINYFNIMGRGNVGYRCYEPVEILKGYDITKPFSFIIFSPVPNETIKEYTNLFRNYKEFQHYNVIQIQGGDKYRKFIDKYDPIKHYIIIISKQTLDSDYKMVKKDEQLDKSMIRLQELLTTIKNKNGEITGIFFDEHHVSGCSKRSQNMLNEFKKPDMFPNLFYVFITATYNKSIFNYNIPANNQFTWNYEDIITCKELSRIDSTTHELINRNKLFNRHGISFKKAIECLHKMGYNLNDIELEYNKFPEIYILTHQWNEEVIKQQISRGGNEIKFGELLRVDQLTNQFVDINGVDGLLRLIFGDSRSFTPSDPVNKTCFLNRIKQISNKINSRTLQDGSFTTQIWFLPLGTHGSGIKSIADALEVKLNNNDMIKKISYKIFNMKDNDVVKGDQENSYKEQIRTEEKKAKDAGYNGLIILTGKQLSLGISLPCVDIVIMLNDIKDLDLYYQMIFRSLTESLGKKAGFICEFNPDRTVSAIYGQAMDHNMQDTIGDIKQKFINEKFVYMDNDMVNEKNISSSQLIEFFNSLKLTDLTGNKILSRNQIKDIDMELKKLINNIEREDIQTQLKHLRFDKVIATEHIKQKIQLENKLSQNQKTLKDLELQVQVRESRDLPEKDEIIKKLKLQINKIKQSIELTQSQLDAKILPGDFILPIIKIGMILTINENFKSINDVFTYIYNEHELTDKLLYKSDLDNIKEYLLLQGIYGPEKNKQLELQRIDYILNLFNPNNENNIIHSMENMGRFNNHIVSSREDIKNNLDMPDTNIHNIEKVMTNRCIKNADGKLEVNEDPSTDELLLESCDEIPSILQKKRLLQYIELNLTPIEELKKKTGEVFTPWELVDEMMQTIPVNFWTNPDHKILEPGSGFGPFAIWAYYRLMVGLRDVILDEEQRRKHIIEKMLYMAELNGVNVDISKTIFSNNELYKPNIYHGDFLELKPEEEWGVSQFDLICGNPPFQNEKSGKTAQGGHDLYPKFFIKSFYLLKNDGFLSFINPAKWRAPDKKGDLKEMWDIFVNNNAIFLKIYGFNETKKIFYGGAVTRIDYYVLQKNTREYNNTIIIDEENKKHKINLRDWNFLPNYDIDNIKRVLTDQDNGIKIIYSRGNYGNDKPHISKEKNGTFIYPVKHTHTINDGDIYFWSNTNKNGHFGEKKVILGKGLYPYPYNDYNGDYGMSNYSFGIPITSKKEGDDIVEAINSEGFKRLISATKWSSGFTDHNMFKYFRPDFYKDFIGKHRKLVEHSTLTSKKSMLHKIDLVSHVQDEEEDDVVSYEIDKQMKLRNIMKNILLGTPDIKEIQSITEHIQELPDTEDVLNAHELKKLLHIMQILFNHKYDKAEWGQILKFFNEILDDDMYDTEFKIMLGQLLKRECKDSWRKQQYAGVIEYIVEQLEKLETDISAEFEKCSKYSKIECNDNADKCKWIVGRRGYKDRCEFSGTGLTGNDKKQFEIFRKSIKASNKKQKSGGYISKKITNTFTKYKSRKPTKTYSYSNKSKKRT